MKHCSGVSSFGALNRISEAGMDSHHFFSHSASYRTIGIIQKNSGYTRHAADTSAIMAAAVLVPDRSCQAAEAVTMQSRTMTGPAAFPESESAVMQISSRADLSSSLFKMPFSFQIIIHLH